MSSSSFSFYCSLPDYPCGFHSSECSLAYVLFLPLYACSINFHFFPLISTYILFRCVKFHKLSFRIRVLILLYAILLAYSQVALMSSVYLLSFARLFLAFQLFFAPVDYSSALLLMCYSSLLMYVLFTSTFSP